MSNIIRDTLKQAADAMMPAKTLEEGLAIARIDKALTLQPYPAASLETAACLWEAVLEMEKYCANGAVTGEHVVPTQRRDQIRACREAIGSSSLRLNVIGWTDEADKAWQLADVDPVTGYSGQYGQPFDWEFIPAFIAERVDWSDPHAPCLKPARPKVKVEEPTIDWTTLARRAGELIASGYSDTTVAGCLKDEFGGQVPLG